jgi:uncharacterized protein affecting Mg2+/Co2+ transport
MYRAITRQIEVTVEPNFMPESSSQEKRQFFWSYTVVITNAGKETVQLKTRHWIITDASGRMQEVRGEGVVGEQPVLGPGERFEQIQLSNSHCSSDMRHRPHCLRRGGAVVSLHSRPLVRGRAERRVPVAPLGLMRMRSSAIVSASGLSEAPSKCPTFRLRCFFGCLHFASANDPITELKSQGDGKGASSD